MKLWLTIIGWLLFIAAMFLPVNGPPKGSLNPKGPDPGFLGVLFSFTGLFSFFFEKSFWSGTENVVWLFWSVCNLTIFLAPITLWQFIAKRRVVSYLIAVIIVLACPTGLSAYKNFSIHYGYFVMCLAFMMIALAQINQLWKSSRLTSQKNRTRYSPDKIKNKKLA